MAITVSVDYLAGSNDLPTGYTNTANPALPAGTVIPSGFSTDIAASAVDLAAATANADTLKSLVSAYFTATFNPDILGLSTLLTIDLNIQIIKSNRKARASFEVLTDEYEVQTTIQYVVTP